MIGFGWKEAAALDLRRDRCLEHVRRVQPRNERLREGSLLGRSRKDGRTVAGTDIGTLPIYLRRVVCDGEINLQQLCVANLRRIVRNLYGLGVPSPFGADRIIPGVLAVASSIAGGDVLDALHMLEDAFHAPETAAREHGSLGFRRCRRGGRDSKKWDKGEVQQSHRRVSFASSVR